MKVLITGASGVLGNAILQAFSKEAEDSDIQVTGLSYSNPSPKYRKLDLQDTQAVGDFTNNEWNGGPRDMMIHCAAERRPDVAEKNPGATQKLNAEVPGQLAQLAKRQKFLLIYISTDYVFDGKSPPYSPNSPTNPLQLYGRTKLAGEQAVLGVDGANVLVLRVPVLYGPTVKPSDSAINILLDVVRDQSGKTYKMDHFATRYPTNVIDIGNFLVKLSKIKDGRLLPKIMHFSAPEPYTKYEIVLLFASILDLPHQHVIADDSDPSSKGETTRPRDCKLDTRETEILLDGVPGGVLGCVGFEEWWRIELSK